jgi:hypothetical protein
MSDVGDELRALIREVIREVLPKDVPVTETVNLSTDEDLTAFVARLLDLDPETREELRAGRRRFRLAHQQVQPATSATHGSHGTNGLTVVNGSSSPSAGPPAGPPTGSPTGPPTRRIERGAVTERVIRDAARAGERLVLGPGAVLTPLARDRARASGVEITKER